jgi:hypothetical protein
MRALIFLAALQIPQPAPPPPPTGLILGRVVDAASGRPIAGAIVALQNGTIIMPGAPLPGPQPRALTNANGQFVFRRLPKGSFGLTVTKPGYVDGAYGRRRPGGTQGALELADGERKGDVVIPVWRFAAVSGTVTDEAGDPAIGVELRMYERRFVAGRRRLAPGPLQITDDRGQYRFGSVIPGDYIVAFVSKEVSMPAATVEILRLPNDPRSQDLQRELSALGPLFLGPTGTQQLGNLARQVNSRAPIPPQPATPDAPIYTYPTQYFPGTFALAQAATLTLKSGQERGSVDFSLRPVKTSRVAGTLVGPDGPVANVALRLLPEGDDFAIDMESSAAISGPSGEFTFLGVMPGQYVVKVLRVPRAAVGPSSTTTIQVGGATIVSSVSGTPGGVPPRVPAEPTLWASVPVAVADGNVTGVMVALQTGARLSGRLEFDGTKERPEPQQLLRLPITIEPTERSVIPGPFTSIPPGRVDESGAFTTYGVPGGKYLVRVGGAPSGWTLRSVVSAGRDVSDTPIDVGAADVSNIVITFTDRPSRLTGVVRGSSGAPDPDAMVVIFPVDPASWTDYGLNPRRMRSVRVAKAGTYTLVGLPPGEYYVAAVNDEGFSTWQSQDVLEALSRFASPVRLAEGDARTQDLKTGAVR